MKLLVLMGGSRILESTNTYPVFLTEINGRLIIEDILETYSKQSFSDCIFCVKQDDIESFNIDSIIKGLVPTSRIVPVKGMTAGASCTALLAQEFIDTEEALVVVSIDDYITCDVGELIRKFSAKDADVGLVSFTSVHPRYSFVKKDTEGQICQITEKKPVSRDALASFYYFKHGCDFVSAVQDEIRKDAQINGAFYISQALNELILRQKKFELVKIENSYFHSFKTERQLAAYIANYKQSGDIV